ncbi:MAG: hypothetical protein ABIL25_01340 [candidate division WOR-3 bacterium]
MPGVLRREFLRESKVRAGDSGVAPESGRFTQERQQLPEVSQDGVR